MVKKYNNVKYKVGARFMDKDILRQLELKRQLMIASGIEHGFLNKKTIHLSKQVDRLINAFDAERFEELTKGKSTSKIIQ